jgi:ABC-type glutathione transport system ATPase component
MEMEMQNDIVVHAEHLNKIFYSIRGYLRQKKRPVQAVKDISFSICKAELFGMVGPNGCKSTIIRVDRHFFQLVVPVKSHNRHRHFIGCQRVGCGVP